jgi:hypothetical protein
MKTYWGSGGRDSRILILGSNGGECSTSRSDRFTPGERVPSTHWTEGRVDPTIGLDAVAMKKFPVYPCRKLYSGLPARSLVTILTELYQNNLNIRLNLFLNRSIILEGYYPKFFLWECSDEFVKFYVFEFVFEFKLFSRNSDSKNRPVVREFT